MRRLYRLVLWLLPSRFRVAHEREMQHLLGQYAEDHSAIGRALLVARACIDIAFVGIGLRLRGLWRARKQGGVMGWTREIRFALRSLRRRPGYTLVAIATLGIGIGANTGIFSVVNGVLLNPLPYPAADRIGILWHEFGDGAQNLPALHALDLRDYRDRNTLFEDFTVATGREWIVGREDSPEIVDVGIAESGFFEFFGVTPQLGRAFTPDEDIAGAAQVVVLSHRLWERRFGADPAIVGQSIRVAGTDMQVVGVLPQSFSLLLPAEAFLLRDAELWTNLRLDVGRQPPRNFTGYTGFGRLRAGVTFDQAQAEIETLAAGLRAEHPVHASSNLRARIVPLLNDVVKGARSTLLLLLGAVGFVLVIACANVANLVIVRGHGRRTEYQIRTALGASRRGLLRLALVESALLAIAGAVIGTLLAQGALSLLRTLGPGSVPRLDAVGMDANVLLFAVALTSLSALLFGVLPTYRATSSSMTGSFGDDRRSTGNQAQRRVREWLVMAEVAASFVLLVGTGLMVRSFAQLTSVQPGFATERALTFRVSLPSPRFDSGDSRDAFQTEFLESVRGLAGVEEATMMSQLPLSGAGPLQPFAYDEETASNWESVSADQRWVAPGFFEAVGAVLKEGRGFQAADAEEGRTIIIDDRLAALAFPEGGAIGGRLQIGPNEEPEEFRYARVVGIVEHLRLHDLSRAHLPQIYWASAGQSRFSVVVRTVGDAGDMVAPIRGELARLAPGAPMEDVRTMGELVHAALAPDRLALSLMTGFGAIALLLASLGIYGMLAYAVSARTREIGLRMALGQTPTDVRSSVMWEGGRLVAGALVIGALAAAGLGGLAQSLLYEVTPLDPGTFLVTGVVLAGAAALACWLPARRATRVDPIAALRAD